MQKTLKKLKKDLFNNNSLFFITGFINLIFIISIFCSIIINNTKTFNLERAKFNAYNSGVMVVTPDKKKGGSGVFIGENTILTNRHVCRTFKDLLAIDSNNKEYTIISTLMDTIHDLCLLKTKEMSVNYTTISKNDVEDMEKIVSVGFPGLHPRTIKEGYMSSFLELPVMDGCTNISNEEIERNPFSFLFCIPKIETYKARYISIKVYPGSSGSPIFNINYELVGLIFAGDPSDGGVIVPLNYIKDFILRCNTINALFYSKIGEDK